MWIKLKEECEIAGSSWSVRLMQDGSGYVVEELQNGEGLACHLCPTLEAAESEFDSCIDDIRTTYEELAE